MLSELDFAYIAGLIDGEGCIELVERNHELNRRGSDG